MITLSVGIDLGTVNSSMAIFDGQELKTIQAHNPIIPSLVYFDPHRKNVIVGRTDVKEHSQLIYDSKRFIGRSFNDPLVQSMRKHYAFKITEYNNNTKFKLLHNNETVLKSPEEVSAEILKYLCDCLSSWYQEEVKIEAVITIPGHFNQSQRDATLKAAKIAKIEILQLMKEPTAVAYNYLLDFSSTIGHILVFDLGGGTFDISVVEKKNEQLNIICCDGDNFLGGRNVDEILLKHFKKKFTNKLLSSLHIGRLLTASKEIKEELSKKLIVTKKLLDFFDDENNDVELKLTRVEFDELINDFIERCFKIVDRCLRKNNVEKTSIKEVLLVGGSTHIVKLQKRIKEYFGSISYPEIDRDLSVTFGAAKRAFILRSLDKSVYNEETTKKFVNDYYKIVYNEETYNTFKSDYQKTVYNEDTAKKFVNDDKKHTTNKPVIDYSKTVYNEDTAKKFVNDNKKHTINKPVIDYIKTVYNEDTAKKFVNDDKKHTINNPVIDYSKTVYNEDTAKKFVNDDKKHTINNPVIDYSKTVYNENTAKKFVNDDKKHTINKPLIDYSKTVYNEDTAKKFVNDDKKHTTNKPVIDYSKTVYNENTAKKFVNDDKKHTINKPVIDYIKTVYNENTAKKFVNDDKKHTTNKPVIDYSRTVFNEDTAKKFVNDDKKHTTNKPVIDYSKTVYNEDTAKKLVNDDKKHTINTPVIDYIKTVYNENTAKKFVNDDKKHTINKPVIDYSKTVYNENTAKKFVNDDKKHTINKPVIDYSKTVYNENTAKKFVNDDKKHTTNKPVIDYIKTVYNENTAKKFVNDDKKHTINKPVIDYSKTVYNEDTTKKFVNDYSKTVYSKNTANKFENNDNKNIANKLRMNDNKTVYNTETTNNNSKIEHILHINDVTSFNIGYKNIFDTFELLVEKNVNLPLTKNFSVQTLRDNQTMISLRFYEGRWKCCSKNHFLGKITFKYLPKKPAGHINVDGTVEINADNKINITANVRETMQKAKLELTEIEETDNTEIWTELLDEQFEELTELKIKFFKSWRELVQIFPNNIMLKIYQCYDILDDIKNKLELKEEMEQFLNDYSSLGELKTIKNLIKLTNI